MHKLVRYVRTIVVAFHSLALAQQIQISRIEMMPNLPSPYHMRNWKEVALRYDSLVFDATRAGQYLPVVFFSTGTVNYPQHQSFGLHTYVGTHAPSSGEAINVLPAVISASLIGVDKRTHYGKDWVLMCEEYFNRRPGENVYLNHPVASSGSDWWYETMPNVFFYQLYDLYGSVGDFDYQFRTVAEQWYRAVVALGGSATPWQLPTMNYRAWSFSTMTPNANGVPQPEAAGAIAWILYHAFVKTGDIRYRMGAEWAMEFLDTRASNPAYELQLSYGALVAARMNAELGTTYDVEKLVRWCFEVGSLRNWGAIVGTWGGYDVSGLIGEVNGFNDYAFAMNTFQQIGALVPLVRYDDRFARAIGKWVLNAANAARLFYSNSLPDHHQDSRTWSQQYDPFSSIAYEALRQHRNNLQPFATGDAIKGGWAATNLALYASSHTGILGAIIDTTNVPMILKLDVLRTDYFRQEAYPTYLYFNPHSQQREVEIQLNEERYDLYDAVSNTMLKQGVSRLATFPVPANGAVLLVVLPAGASATYTLGRMIVNGIVADYRSAVPAENHPPRIKGLAARATTVLRDQRVFLYCAAVDRDGDPLMYEWSRSAGVLDGSGAVVGWTAPSETGVAKIWIRITDARGAEVLDSLILNVVEAIPSVPIIQQMLARPAKVDLGGSAQITVTAVDTSGAELTYSWQTDAGAISGVGAHVILHAPAKEGNFYVRCRVENAGGGFATDSALIVVRDFSKVSTGNLMLHLPLDGDAQDRSGFDNHGTVFGAVLTADRNGHPNRAFWFNGSNDLIRVTNNPGLNFQNAITVSYWMRIDEFFGREAYPISHGNWENRWKISITNKRIRWTIKTTAGIKDLDSRTELSTQLFYHVVTTYNGEDMEIYVNGELEAITTFSGTLLQTTHGLSIGQHLPTVSGYNFKGVLDEIRIYNYALGFHDIQKLYDSTVTRVQAHDAAIVPTKFHLYQNYPNPFNAATNISFDLPKATHVSLRVIDVLGRAVAVLLNKDLPAGTHSTHWQAHAIPSGVYFAVFRTPEYDNVKKLLIIR